MAPLLDKEHGDWGALKGPRDWNISRSWNFQARLKISSEPPTKPLFFEGNSEDQDWNFQTRLKFQARFNISGEIEFFKIWALRAVLSIRVCIGMAGDGSCFGGGGEGEWLAYNWGSHRGTVLNFCLRSAIEGCHVQCACVLCGGRIVSALVDEFSLLVLVRKSEVECYGGSGKVIAERWSSEFDIFPIFSMIMLQYVGGIENVSIRVLVWYSRDTFVIRSHCNLRWPWAVAYFTAICLCFFDSSLLAVCFSISIGSNGGRISQKLLYRSSKWHYRYRQKLFWN